MPWWVSSRSSSQRMPVSLRTSIVAKPQNASSSSYDRLRRLPEAVSSARTCRPLALGAMARRSVPPAPSMISPGGGVMAAGGGAGEDGQDGQPLAGPLVHPGLAPPAFLGPVDLGVADRARDCPLRPASGLLGGPLGDVEIERPDAYQLVLGVDPRAGDDGLPPVGAGDAALDGQQVFLPGAGDLRRQLQRGDARGQCLDPGPEQAGQGR